MMVTAAARVALTCEQTPESRAAHHAAPSRARQPTPSRLWLRHKHSGCLRLAAAHPHLRLTCTHGPGRSFADRRGTTLRLKHRLQLRDGASKKMTRTCHQDDARTATGHLREDSSCCRRVGAVVLPNHPQAQRIAACEAVLEEAARSRTLNPPHWRRAARSVSL